MSIKSVVKVMNFHSLLRVDKSRNQAKKYTALENVLTDMIDNIVNNRNVMLDYNTLWVDPKNPVLNIYIGSDMGFCNNLNSLVKREIENGDENSRNIVIGRKIRQREDERRLLFMTREEYNGDNSKVMQLLEEGIRKQQFSQINLVYNHYYNSTQVELVNKQVFPLEKKKVGKEALSEYQDDFAFEGDVNDLLTEMVVLYVRYSMEIAAAASFAAENISRQNVTTESLKKIDEREEVFALQERKEKKDKQFARVLDDFTKLKYY